MGCQALLQGILQAGALEWGARPSVRGILQAGVLEWGARPSSGGSLWPRDGLASRWQVGLYCWSHQGNCATPSPHSGFFTGEVRRTIRNVQ